MKRSTKLTVWFIAVFWLAFVWGMLIYRAFAAPVWHNERATWYGPGFYGNGTRCGQTYTEQIRGIAVRRMACGTKLTICRRGTCVKVKVIDGGGSFDLSARTAQDLCKCWSPYTMNVRWHHGWINRPAARK